MFRLIKSVGHAARGVRLALAEEPNFRIHLTAAVIAILLGVWLGLAAWEWVVIILVIALVFALETVNSIFERVIDLVKPSVNSYVKDMKDMMAGSVVVGAIAAIIIGLIIFGPKLLAVVTR